MIGEPTPWLTPRPFVRLRQPGATIALRSVTPAPPLLERMGPCAACGCGGPDIPRRLVFTGPIELGLSVLCIDAVLCARTYRAGQTPQEFAHALR